MMEGLGADSVEKHEPASDIDTAVADSLKALDLKRPIREADIWGGPFRAISEVGPALFNRFGGAHRVAPGSIDTPGLLTHP
jgi:hypothetical protein